MGKKSKRKNNKPAPCYHGCTKHEFNNSGEHFKVLQDFGHVGCESDDSHKFYEKFKHVLVNPTFGRFVIARVTSDYLKGKDDTLLLKRLLLLVQIRYLYIPRQEGKDVGLKSDYTNNNKKYTRDIMTKRGRINVMAREIPCDCMDEKKKEAKLMEKTAGCYGCQDEFPKKQMLRCKGCDFVQYCSKECRIKHWPKHNERCAKRGVSSKSTPTPIPTPVSIPSSFGEPSDVDAE